MTSSQPESTQQDLAAVWSSVRRLHPIYAELAREFVIDVPACAELEGGAETPAPESVARAQQWLNHMDEKIQVHQLRQFLQTSSVVDNDGLAALLQHFLVKTPRTDSARDKIDFQGMEPIFGKVELRTPLWLNALDRVLDSARRCRSLDELLHGGVLEQGRKAKAQAGDLFYLPIALVAFTRFGYLMRRVFFRLMLADLNNILDGLAELDERGVETIDCRRAQFSDKEPIIRLRMICQSWKVMFQAEYSSGQPLRMLVDLRASVDAALGKGLGEVAPASAAPRAAAAAAGAGGSGTTSKPAAARETSSTGDADVQTKFAVAHGDAPEFEISAAPQEWNPDEDPQPENKE